MIIKHPVNFTQLERSTLVRYARNMNFFEIAAEDGVTRAALNARVKTIRERMKMPKASMTHLICVCLYNGLLTLGDIFESQTQGKAAGIDLSRRNNVETGY